MSLELGKEYLLDGRKVKVVAKVPRPVYVMEFLDRELTEPTRELVAGKSNQFVMSCDSLLVKELKEI